MKRYLLNAALVMSLSFTSSALAEVVTLTSKKGDNLIVTLLAKQGDKVLIKRASDNKEFAISLDTLSDESQASVSEKMKLLKAVYPPLDIKVSVNKRRKHKVGSSYIKVMTVSAKITVTNEDNRISCPSCNTDIIFIGQDQRDPSKYKILSSQEREIIPHDRGYSFSSESFDTEYDSDNKGVGNWGGYKYVGYLFVVCDDNNEVLHTKTNYVVIEKALESSVTKAADLMSYASGTILDKSMSKPESK